MPPPPPFLSNLAPPTSNYNKAPVVTLELNYS